MDKKLKAIAHKFNLTNRKYRKFAKQYRRMEEWRQIQIYADTVVNNYNLGQALRLTRTRIHILERGSDYIEAFKAQLPTFTDIIDPDSLSIIFAEKREYTNQDWYYL